jgi:hypothetical protein
MDDLQEQMLAHKDLLPSFDADASGLYSAIDGAKTRAQCRIVQARIRSLADGYLGGPRDSAAR